MIHGLGNMRIEGHVRRLQIAVQNDVRLELDDERRLPSADLRRDRAPRPGVGERYPSRYPSA